MDVAGVSEAPGVRFGEEATRFALASGEAMAVELCLFDDPGAAHESRRVPLERGADGLWRTELRVAPGQLYGYRVDGPWDPAEGLRFNPAKLLIDPRAQAISGRVRWSEALRGARLETPHERDGEDSAPWMPRGVVVDPGFDWGADRPPRVPWGETVVYECHVKGLTQLHPAVPADQRGRYQGLAHPAVLEHLRSLGVTTLELLPVHHHALDAHLAGLGLENYWGYATLGFFAPDARFATGGLGEQVREFKAMVKALHAAGFEVLLDVVYNHTAEGPPNGPCYSLRGVDNRGYYRLDPRDSAQYQDVTGTGNTLDVRKELALELIVDSLRHWVRELHVDGFRFDLAPALARDPDGPHAGARFFQRVQGDPLLAGVKLIAEPWDLGPGGYQLGRFPAEWSEWNGVYRDQVCGFWNGGDTRIGELAGSLAGSRGLFEGKAGGVHAGVNLVTCHDGFTLRDLVSYERKHNLDNGEENRDGPDHASSNNWGEEGPSTHRRVRRARERARRNLVATLALSLGVPMISHGDELGRTQRGNNNAYCHDDERTWVDWTLTPEDEEFLEFFRSAFALRAANPSFRRAGFLTGLVDAAGRKDVIWLHPRGHELGDRHWEDPRVRAFGMLLPPVEAPRVAARSALLLLNGGKRKRSFQLPAVPAGARWREVLHTACTHPRRRIGGHLLLAPLSLVALELETDEA